MVRQNFSFFSTLCRYLFSPISAGFLSGLTAISLQWFALQSPQASDNHIAEQEDPHLTARVGSSLGYRGLTASNLWLSFIQYYGHEARQEVGYAYVSDFFESIVESEPRFVDAYFLASSAVAIRSGEPDNAVNILEKGLATVTPDWYGDAYRIPHQLASLNFLYLGDVQKSREYYYQAADWYEATYADSRQGWRALGNNIANNPRSKLAQFNAWMQSFQVNPDPEIQDYILEKLGELGEVNRLPDGSIQIIPPTES
ncbi:MAG: hypothetical protein AB4040_14155 [Synechococcus sp.]